MDAKLGEKQEKKQKKVKERKYYYFSPFDQFVEDADGNVESRLPMTDDDLTHEALQNLI